MTELIIQGLTKRFGAVTALSDFDLHIADGEFVTLLGPSGCGKSTTLAAVAGLDQPTDGSIRTGETVLFDGQNGFSLPAEQRNFGLVFQSYALWPHMSVRDNVAFPLKLRKVKGAEKDRRVTEALGLVEMESYADRYPHELSGGQQQRVALARTLVYKPDVLLLDEPLSNLDAKLRERARVWLGQLKDQVRLTTIYVTHDQSEALALSDRIVVMNKGRIVQIGTPHEIYASPADPFVADFIGTSSFFPGRVVGNDTADGNVVSIGEDQFLRLKSHRTLPLESSVRISVRPDRMRLLQSKEQRPGEDGAVLSARVLSCSYLGARFQYELDVAGSIAKVESQADVASSQVYLWVPSEGAVLFAA
ncbi:ABC transporter ATP-binding protein [Bosea sp. TAF32]|uniref:ABC transporter ATP-binding protein n=1 Tax=Bosea sp. TAF32 TaxID=3237482 RepID=UPI003F907235